MGVVSRPPLLTERNNCHYPVALYERDQTMNTKGIALLIGIVIGGAAHAELPPATPANTGQKPTAEAGSTKGSEQLVSFEGETQGAPPAQLEALIGDWNIGELSGVRGLWVDGTKWRQGTPSASLADQAKRLYGDRYAEFLDGVKAFAFYPLAVYRGDCTGEDLTLSVRFYPQSGRIDQAAGIAWSIAPDGSYFGTRANALEGNLLFFKVVRGKRVLLQTVRNVVTDSKKWHTLKVRLHGKTLAVEVNDKEVLKRGLDAPANGRCGLWSKADSQVLFDDFRVRKGSGGTGD